MALDGPTDSSRSSYRSLHWAPLRSWNLFTGRVRSRIPEEQPPVQLPRSRSLRNYGGEGRRVGSATSRSTARIRSNERARKGADNVRRDRSQRVGSHMQGTPMAIDEPVTLPSGAAMARNGATSRRRGHHARVSDISDGLSLLPSGRPGTITQYQQHHAHQHHHDSHHHHHHFYYHHQPRRSHHHEQQGPSGRIVSAGTDPTSRATRRDTDQHRHAVNERASLPSNSHVPTNARSAAIEARDRLAERLRGAVRLSNRRSHGGLPGRLLQEFSLLMEDEEDGWSDDEMWELGVHDWLAAWGHGAGVQSSNMLSSSEQFVVSQGLSKSTIRSLHREVFVPKVRTRDRELVDAPLEHHDCSVCLEHFLPGQVLVRLPCKHRFHPDCLTPWLENHSQCPYCRAKVLREGSGGTISGGGVTASAMEDDLTAWVETLEAEVGRLSIW